MMGRLPFRIDDRPFPNFDDAIAGHKPNSFCRLNEIHVSPLVAVVVDVITHLTEKDSLWLKNFISFLKKRRIRYAQSYIRFP